MANNDNTENLDDLSSFSTTDLVREIEERCAFIILEVENLKDLLKATWIKENFDKIKEKGNTYVLEI